jgi:hypothetical protein
MYYLNKDGTIDNGNQIQSIMENPMEIISMKKEDDNPIEIQEILIEPHTQNCKCVKCFITNKVGNKVTYNNALIVIAFLIFMYLLYMLLIRLFM